MVGAIALASGGDDDPKSTPRAEATAEATASPDKTEEPKATETASPEPTATASPEPTPTAEATEAPASGGAPDLDAARTLQLEGYNARRAGDFQTALEKSRAAQQACGGSKELSPCGYAVFEEGAALVGLGQSEAAIPVFERRLNEFGDNESGEVEKALRKARKDARKER